MIKMIYNVRNWLLVKIKIHIRVNFEDPGGLKFCFETLQYGIILAHSLLISGDCWPVGMYFGLYHPGCHLSVLLEKGVFGILCPSNDTTGKKYLVPYYTALLYTITTGKKISIVCLVLVVLEKGRFSIVLSD